MAGRTRRCAAAPRSRPSRDTACTSSLASGDHGPDLDRVGVPEPFLPRDELTIPDHEHRVRIHLELEQQLTHGAWPRDHDLPVGIAHPDLHEPEASAAPTTATDPTNGARPGGGRVARIAAGGGGGVLRRACGGGGGGGVARIAVG